MGKGVLLLQVALPGPGRLQKLLLWGATGHATNNIPPSGQTGDYFSFVFGGPVDHENCNMRFLV